MRTADQDHAADEMDIALKDVQLQGFLRIPKSAKGIVIFAHGSGSSRLSPRNQFVAGRLNQKRIGTLLFDLLTEQEEEEDAVNGQFRFDIPFLAGRLGQVADWLVKDLKAGKTSRPLGFFGASTGAAAAIEAAVQRPEVIKAVVSRGGRPDLAAPFLSQVQAPTLLIVGGEDTDVLRLNEQAYRQIRAPKELYIVKGATHLFEEPGALEEAAQAAGRWFEKYLGGGAP